MIRPLLAEVGRWIESLVSPPPSVLEGVAAAKLDQSGYLHWSEDRPAAVDAAGAGPEAVSTTPRVPASGRPTVAGWSADPDRLLIESHYIAVMSPDGYVQCHCRKWEGQVCAHADHIADVVCEQRISHFGNEFQK